MTSLKTNLKIGVQNWAAGAKVRASSLAAAAANNLEPLTNTFSHFAFLTDLLARRERGLAQAREPANRAASEKKSKTKEFYSQGRLQSGLLRC